MKINLYDETIKAINGRKIAYAKIKVHNDIFGDDVKYINLKPNHTYSEGGEFYNSLRNINYDNGYGSQYIFGFVVFTDGTWIERKEYDGSEWWGSKRCPIFTDLV